MTLTTIEKAARLMGYDVDLSHDDFWVLDSDGNWLNTWNPRTNKAGLMDVETELGIDVEWDDSHSGPNVKCTKRIGSKFTNSKLWLKDHPTKFAARAEAVLSVVSQLYDAKFGKDGE